MTSVQARKNFIKNIERDVHAKTAVQSNTRHDSEKQKKIRQELQEQRKSNDDVRLR